VAELAGARGGGRPNLAQAGGGDPERIGQALAAAAVRVAELLGER
jgi:alanyl-tRNA synthetase